MAPPLLTVRSASPPTKPATSSPPGSPRTSRSAPSPGRSVRSTPTGALVWRRRWRNTGFGDQGNDVAVASNSDVAAGYATNDVTFFDFTVARLAGPPATSSGAPT